MILNVNILAWTINVFAHLILHSGLFDVHSVYLYQSRSSQETETTV